MTNTYTQTYKTNTAPERCPCCGQIISWRVITIYSGMVKALIRVWFWCKKNGRHEFTRKEIKDILGKNPNEIARWGDWIIFGGGMVYKPQGKGSWGLNMERVEEFIRGERAIPIKVAKGRRAGEIEVLEYGTIKDIKGLGAFLDANQQYIVEYLPPVKPEPQALF